MRIGIISDIHSNVFALRAVLNEITKEGIDDIILLGDIFGYYPWASETYKLLMDTNLKAAIKGNHDLIVLEEDTETQSNHLAYYHQARFNHLDLKENCPESLIWLAELHLQDTLSIGQKKITICHGTPDNPSNGRYYPDDNNIYEWFPDLNQILMIGHTHYPLSLLSPAKGMIINPGSVGQPRDGNPAASWGILNLSDLNFEIRRSYYNNLEACELLKEMNWDIRSIFALNKNYKGKLRN